MLHFIVDGYNLTKKISRLLNLPLKEQRNYLLQLLEDFRSKISSRNKITVIFDGSTNVYSRINREPSIKVMFSQGEDADSLIKRIIDQAGNPKSLVVITDDRAIINYGKFRGLHHKSTSEFLSDIKKKTERPQPDDFVKLDFRQARKITEELKSIWKKKY